MKKFWQITTKSFVIVSVWWLALTLFASYRVGHYGVSPTFPYYNSILAETNPRLGVWAHFDGAHYLKLARVGYVDNGTQAFFPVYPALINFLHQFGLTYFTAARLLSFISLLGSIILIQYLFPATATWIIITTLIFPVSFFLAGVYTESLFLFELLLFFLLLRRRSYFLAALIAALASGTRLVGIILAFSLFLELCRTRRHNLAVSLLLALLSSTGLLAYMYFLYIRFGDPLAFIHVQSMFGAGRSGGELIMLPQLLFRYFKIFFTVDFHTFIFQRALLELLSFIGGAYLFFRNFRHNSAQLNLFLFGALTLPTLSGTLSSYPRYLLVLLPFLLFRKPSPYLTTISVVILILLLSLFAGGTFVS